MKILHTSDWHLGKPLEKIDRTEEQKEFIDELVTIADDNSIDLVLVTGDIFDTYNPPSQAEYMFCDALNRLSCYGKRAIVVMAGNHDSPERLCAVNPLVRNNGVYILGYPKHQIPCEDGKDIKVVRSGKCWFEISISSCRENAVILTLPYPSEQRLNEILSEEFNDEDIQKAYSDKIGSILREASSNFRNDTVNIVASHIYVNGGRESGVERPVQLGGAFTVNTDVFPQNSHYIALGHLHRPQEIKREGLQIRYCGSPLAYNFTESEHSKVVNVVEVTDKVKVEEIYLKSGRPLRRWKAKNGIEEAIQWCKDGKDPQAWIDLEVYTDRVLTIEEQKELRSLNNRIVNIRPIIIGKKEDISYYDKREDKKMDELFKEFYRHKTGTEVDDEVLNLFLEIANEEENTSETSIS